MKKQSMISNDALASLCWELSVLLRVDEGVGSALDYMAQESDPEYKEMLTDMAERADFGAPLSDVMEAAGRFPSYVYELVRVGERSNSPVDALKALSAYYDSRARLDRRIRSALLYPAVMLMLMLVVIAVLLVRVLPIFDDVYASLGGRLTGVAGGLLALGRGLDRAMPVLLVLLVAVVVFLAAFAALPSFRERLTAAWRTSRGDKGLARKMNDARLAQALAMGMASGKSLDASVRDASNLLEDVPQAKARCQACLDLVDEGKELSAAIKESGMLPASACHLLKTAHRGGNDAEAVEKIAADLEEESESALEEQVSRVEPALVLVCSLLVGLILLSVMLPLMHIMSAIG